MSSVDGLIDVEDADITVNSNFNLNFDWGTIGIIVGACVAILIVIFVIVYFCGRGSATCCDNGKYQIHLECTQVRSGRHFTMRKCVKSYSCT